MTISIINSGSGNIGSLKNMLDYLGLDPKICENPNELNKSKYIFLPGVGTFDELVYNLKLKGFYSFLKNKENFAGSELIGICIGMHILFENSEEGNQLGLNLLNGKIKKFSDINQKIPHMGWNNVEGDNFFENCNQKKFYFAHSYHVVCEESIIVAKCNYGKNIPVYIKKNNIHGIQFHPEKSHKNGMQLLKNLTKSHS